VQNSALLRSRAPEAALAAAQAQLQAIQGGAGCSTGQVSNGYPGHRSRSDNLYRGAVGGGPEVVPLRRREGGLHRSVRGLFYAEPSRQAPVSQVKHPFSLGEHLF